MGGILSGSCVNIILGYWNVSESLFSPHPLTHHTFSCCAYQHCFSAGAAVSLFNLSIKKRKEKAAKQTANPPLWHCLGKKKKKRKKRPRTNLRFTRVAICMLRPINFSWLSHYEHSQPEGGNAKLICVLKLLSQASITGKCSDYPLGIWEGHV